MGEVIGYQRLEGTVEWFWFVERGAHASGGPYPTLAEARRECHLWAREVRVYEQPLIGEEN